MDDKKRKIGMMVSYGGRKRSLLTLSVELGFSYITLYLRLRAGMTIEDAVSIPQSYRPKIE